MKTRIIPAILHAIEFHEKYPGLVESVETTIPAIKPFIDRSKAEGFRIEGGVISQNTHKIVELLNMDITQLFPLLQTDGPLISKLSKLHKATVAAAVAKARESRGTQGQPPPMMVRAKSLAKSAVGFVKSGMALTDDPKFAERMKVCNGCDKMDKQAFMGTGMCTACGCSLKTKLRMKSEKCPLGKW